MEFWNPSRGSLDLEQVVADIVDFMKEAPAETYRLIIGTDSQNHPAQGTTTFAVAIIIHRVGKGARYYFRRESHRLIRSLSQRLYAEAAMSVELGEQVQRYLREAGALQDIEVHLDIGEEGASRQLIREVVGWVTSSGYTAKIKPDSFGASKVADKYTKA
ncbi:MAG: ribonuclease H-like YkuK family protein [Alicyclobacillaceae bacterium]|nr:ribonuclease H-like YkuK family protein [Alicyclobacillaceae bacterium]